MDPLRREWIPVSVARKHLCCSRVTIYRYLECGELDGFQRTEGGWWMVKSESVLRKMNKQNIPNSMERLMVNNDGR